MRIEDIKWNQTRRQAGSKQRDPIQGEFFNTDSLTELATAITREGIGQNPLDAYVENPVRVRVYVSGADGALDPDKAATYFRGLREHVEECDPGAAAQFENSCPFIVIEDFNTTGLLGDPAAVDEPVPPERNDFFYFFRAEGKSGKTGADRGRWGVGKYVFPMASHINSFFGLSVSSEDSSVVEVGPLLVGQAVLRNHRTASGDRYEPDGWWARYDVSVDEIDRVPLPITAPEVINRFRKDWNVSRRLEPGLSVVVPYVREDLGAEDLVKAILVDYHFAIVAGRLEVQVATPKPTPNLSITAASLGKALYELTDAGLREELRHRVALARWYLGRSADDFIHVQRIETGAPAWSPDRVDERSRSKLRAALDAGERVALRVPVEVSEKQRPDDSSWSYFDVVMEGSDGYRGKPIYVREGLIVPDVPAPAFSNVRCFLSIDDRALAQMVGDAEGPAHTNWSPRTQKFVGKYAYGREWLSFIKTAPVRILSIVREEDQEPDPRIMTRYFPAPPTAAGPQPPGPGPGPAPPSPPTPQPRQLRVSRIRGGFSVNLTELGRDSVRRVMVKAAYDRRRGSPFRNWHAEDFDLSSKAMKVEVRGGAIDECAGNSMTLSITDPAEFNLRVSGFDTNRDIRVDVRGEAAHAAV